MKKQSVLGNVKRFFQREQSTGQLAVILLAVFIAMVLFKPGVVLKPGFIINMFYLFPEYGILAIAMMFPIIAGGIDLSIVATANFASIIGCTFLISTIGEGTSGLAQGLLLAAAVIIAMLVGVICGLVPGFLVAELGIPPMLATLGAADLIMGLSLGFTKGSAITGIPSVLSSVCGYNIFGFIPVTLVVFALVAAAASLLLSKSTFGVKLYMMGSNATAAQYSGLNNKLIIHETYMISGMFAAVSGMLMCAHFNSAKANLGSSYLTPSILICLLGGVNPMGGFGKVKNVVLAVGILQVLSSVINMIPSISTFYRDLLWGGVLLLVMSVNYVMAMSKEKRSRRAGTGK